METTPTVHPRATTRAEIRRGALRFALSFGLGCSVWSAFEGVTPLRSVLAGVACFLVGMMAWAVYHATIGQNDGLIIAASGLMPGKSMVAFPDQSLASGAMVVVLVTLIVHLPGAWLMGRWRLASMAAAMAAKARPSSPLHDAEIDDPRSGLR